MPIAYLRATFPRLLPDGGAQKLFAYLFRYDVTDRVTGRRFAFSDIAIDLVYQAVIVPNDAPPDFANPEGLARAIDEVEAHRLQKPRKVKRDTPEKGPNRFRQVAANFVAVLPPDDEMTYDEVVDLVHRLADHIRRDLPIAICIAIHDPARATPGAINRHAHLLATTRFINNFGWLKKKIREIYARPRQAGGQTYVAEGDRWPQAYAEILTGFLEELGLDLAVSPHRPVGHRHFPKSVWQNEPQHVLHQREKVERLNQSIVSGAKEDLLLRLLRGRSTMAIAELQQLVAGLFDSEEERAYRLSEILEDRTIVTLAVHPGDRSPSRVTTRAIHDLITAAVALVVPEQTFLLSISGGDKDEVTSVLARRIADHLPQRLILVGQIHSHCQALAQKVPEADPIIVSVQELVRSPQTSPASHVEILAGDLIILPLAEQTNDRWVAELVVAAANSGAKLIIGYDRGQKIGIVLNRLAGWITETVDHSGTAPIGIDFQHELRRGRVDGAINSLAALGVLKFEGGSRAEQKPPDFVVCDDATDVARGALQTETADSQGLDHGPYVLYAGAWVALTKTDYSTLPPALRAARLVQIVHVRPDERTIVVCHNDGRFQDIDLAIFPHVRPARFISLRESRHAPKDARLVIRLTKPRRAWACMLAATIHGTNAVVEIDPRVAETTEQLIEVVQRSLPSALPTELFERRDPDADVTSVLTQAHGSTNFLAPAHTQEITPELEIFPEPDHFVAIAKPAIPVSDPASHNPSHQTIRTLQQTFSRNPDTGSIKTTIPRHRLHDKLWTVLASTAGGQTFIDRLENLRDHEHATEIHQRLLDLCVDQGPVCTLIRAAMPPKPAPPSDQTPQEEADAPRELQELFPRDWDLWDVWRFKMDIRTFNSASSSWASVFDLPIADVAKGHETL